MPDDCFRPVPHLSRVKLGGAKPAPLSPQRAVHLFILSLLLWALVPQLRSAEGSVADPSEIVLGMSTALTGPAAALGTDMRLGVLVGFDRANRAGGVKGRKLRLVALDDGYEPARTAPNMRRLLDEEQVLAVIGDVGTPTAIVAVPLAKERRTLFFAPFTGGRVLRQNPPDRYVVNYRASYAEEVGTIIDGLLEEVGLQPSEIAFFTQRDGYGDTGFRGGVDALQRHGWKDEQAIPHVRYERNTLAVENAVASLLLEARPPRAIVMVGAYRPCAKFIQLCREAGLRAIFLNVSFVGSVPLATELGKTDAPVVVMQVVPSPFDRNLPIVQEYITDLQALEPSAQPSFGDLEGYIAARILVNALGKIVGVPTREGIVDAIESLGEFDLGIGHPLRLGPDEHQACHRVWATLLQDGSFVPFRWPELARLVNQDPAK